MEAAATPFPREETTPPVTNINFGAVLKGARVSPGITGYEQLCGETRLVSNYELRCKKLFLTTDTRVSVIQFILRAQNFLHFRNVRRQVNADSVVLRLDHPDLESVLQPAKLFELLDALEFPRR